MTEDIRVCGCGDESKGKTDGSLLNSWNNIPIVYICREKKGATRR